MNGFKVAVVGAGSSYTPEIVEGLALRRTELPVGCLAFTDINHERMETVAGFCRRFLAHPEPGRLLGLGQARGASHPIDGMDVAMAAVSEAIAGALEAAGGVVRHVRSVCAGLTGADWPDEYELLREELVRLQFGQSKGTLPCPIHVTNDCIVALRGGTEQPYGAIIVLGSGGNCAVRSPAGEEFIYGYYHDDDLQGGHSLGRAALWAAYRDTAGSGPATALTQRVLEFYGAIEMDEVRRTHVERRLPRPMKDLAPVVFDEADRGDGCAREILVAFGEGCARLVLGGLRRFDMLELPVDVVLSGSIFKAREPLLARTLRAAILEQAPQARLVNARYEPVVGAALLALERRACGVTRPCRRTWKHRRKSWGWCVHDQPSR